MTNVVTSADSVARTIEQLASEASRRIIIGFAGPPGSGKSTVVQAVADKIGRAKTAIVPMDGFHLASSAILGTPLVGRRGAPDTFDVGGYINLLQRLRRNDEPTVYAPDFERSLEEPIAGAIAVNETTQIVLTEGNYLLLDEQGWNGAHQLLDITWYIDTPHPLRIERLIRRHVEFGKSPSVAVAWANGPDQQNAELVESTRSRADHIVRWN